MQMPATRWGFLFPSDLCPGDGRGPEGQVSSSEAPPRSSLRGDGPGNRPRAGTAPSLGGGLPPWAPSRCGLRPSALSAPLSCLHLVRPLVIRETGPSCPGPARCPWGSLSWARRLGKAVTAALALPAPHADTPEGDAPTRCVPAHGPSPAGTPGSGPPPCPWPVCPCPVCTCLLCLI
uniref:Uncharacterized protein n=1 Tax=Pipistrellus kuhlii TaxID=59472 RepID=A0A7J7RTI9_PIPKU|nr:hypothetical protein mPipKuh1_010238 [Pipistrellus kuhlii]